MYRKTFFLVCCFVLACMAGSASAADKVWQGNVDTDWFNPNNWSPVGVPVGKTGVYGDKVIINGGKANYPVIDAAGAECMKLWMGTVADTNEAYLTIETGGELTVKSGDTTTGNQTICLGQKPGTHGILTMNGGQINMVIGEQLEVGGRGGTVGWGGNGTYNVYGGIHKDGDISVPGYAGPATGVLNLDGGVIDCNSFAWAAETKTGTVNIYSGTLHTDYLGFQSGGYCNLYGGVIDSNDYKMYGGFGLFDIYDGIWYNHSQKPGAEFGYRATYDVRYYCNFDPPAIVAYGGRGTVSIEWEGWDLPSDDPNYVAESELRNLYLTDPNFVWWVRADFNSNLAYWPEPVDGFGAADPDQTLSWAPGYNGNATHHDIYFGTNSDDVNDANTLDSVYVGRQTVDNNSIARSVYSPSGPHTLGGVYYWRIDEVNEADEPDTIWKGTVWSFSISYVILEDFESYTTSAGLGISWVPTGSAGTGVYLVPAYAPGPYLGAQSMMLRAFTTTGTPPVWGEARHTFAADQKWDPANTDARLLAFSVYGTATNSATIEISVKLKDSAGKEAVRYVSGLAQTLAWTEVLFDLDAFTSPAVVDLSKVKQIAIGVKSNVKTSTKTDVFVDNVRLYLAGCYPNYLWSNTDFNRDCITNMSDVGILVTTGNWLMSNWDVTPAAPAVGPVLKYEFNGDANDSSGNGYNATIYDDDGIQWEAGHLGENPGALVFDGLTTHVNDIPLGALSTVSDQVTVSFWMYGATSTGSRTVFDGSKAGLQYDDRLMLMITGSTASAAIGSDDANSVDGISSGTLQTTDMAGQWNHYAVVKDCDANHMAIYVNGELVGNEQYPGRRTFAVRDNPVVNITKLVIGTNVRVEDRFSGRIDDFRIYDYAMTQAEVASLAGKVVLFAQPLERLLQSGYNYDLDLNDDRMIDFKDYAEVAEMWLVQWLFGN